MNIKKITYFIPVLLALFFLSNSSLLLVNGVLDLNTLEEYESLTHPDYITKDNTPINNSITNEGATLGRVLFYDKQLSVDNSTACASCHLQAFAFSDTAQLSVGRTGGLTGRHATRLVNSRFGDEVRFFWDERAESLEDQSTQPIRDHVEMGFSGTDGDPDIDSLFNKMESISYYQSLFSFAYGDPQVTEERIQLALAQFIRSIQGFDSKYDIGRAQVNNNNAPFPNFTDEENTGKQLFRQNPANGGAGCNGCHRAPEFSIDPNSRNNNIVGVNLNPALIDVTNTRAPSLRDLINPQGELNGPMMHTGEFDNLLDVVNHYNAIDIVSGNNNLDNRLKETPGPDGVGQNLNLTDDQKNALVAFLQTLTSSDVYTNEMWANPFDESGNLEVIYPCSDEIAIEYTSITPFPSITQGSETIQIGNLDANGVVTVSSNDRLYLQAQNSILIDVGTSIEQGAIFDAMIGDCEVVAENESAKNTIIEEIPPTIPPDLQLQISPNPFSRQTTIQYSLTTDSPVNLTIYDMNGRIVKRILYSKEQIAGHYRLDFIPCNMDAGMYLCHLEVGGKKETVRVLKTN